MPKREATVRSLALVTVLCLLAVACGGDDQTTTLDVTEGTTAIPTPGLPVTYTGPDGVETVVTDASRIVTVSGDMTEIVFALGLGPNVVGADLSSVYPEEAKALNKVGVDF